MPNPPARDGGEVLRRCTTARSSTSTSSIGRLVAELKRRGLYDNTLIVLTADHGEEFHEHGGWWHGTTLYDEQIGVPLIVKPPRGGATGPRRRRAGHEPRHRADDPGGGGRAAAGCDAGARRCRSTTATAPARDSVFAEEDLEGNVLQAVRTRDVEADHRQPGQPARPSAARSSTTSPRIPASRRAWWPASPCVLEEMRAALGRSYLEARAHAGAGAQTDVDSVTKERLRALGYVD